MKVLHYWAGVGAICVSILGATSLLMADDKKPFGTGDMPNMPQMSPEEMEMMKKWMAHSTPGEHHARLSKLAGKWSNETKVWMSPDQPEPEVSSGTTKCEMILGGRFLKEHHSGSMMGQPFEGLGLTGWDNSQQKIVGAWFDNMSTGMMAGEGKFSTDGKEIHSTWMGFCCMENGPKKMRAVEKWLDADTRVTDFFTNDPAGKEFKTMSITYTRVR